MTDKGVAETDKALAALETRINRVYAEQKKEIEKKAKAFMQEFDTKNKVQMSLLKAGKITEEAYKSWVGGQIYQKKWFDEMANQMAVDMTLSDVKAMSMVKGFMPQAYAINRNFGAFEAEKGALASTSFTLYNAHTVERLVKDRPKLLPNPSPNIPKEMRWHQIKITNEVRNGILQGESVQEIAKRLQNVTDMDDKAALRNARTATTGAQNAGRDDSYKEAQKLGIKMKRQWVATLDERTRDRHRLMDGEQAEVGEKFSNKCRYPGDPEGAPEEIYNCRCVLIGVPGAVDYSTAERSSKLGGMSYEDWKFQKDDEKKYGYYTEAAKNKLNKLGNPVYSGIWKDDVKLSDYPSKKDSIQGKKDYYNDEIDKLKNDPDYKSWMHDDVKKDKIEQYEKYLKDITDFENKGQLYEKYLLEYNENAAKLKEIKGVTGPFTADAYSDERKKAAKSFSSRRSADAYLRPELDRQWSALDDKEKYGCWKYTENSNPMNKPLSGYEDSWNRSSFKGVGNARWDSEDNWRSNPSSFKKFGHSNGRVDHASAISGLTTGIDKCALADDMWFVRGSDVNGLAGLLEGDVVSFDQAKRLLARGDIDSLKALLEGQTFQSHAFLSTGVAGDAGFSGEIKYKIFAPQGTKCMYAEPQSYYGRTHGGQSVLYKPGDGYSGVGAEAEMIFQRGTTYRMAGIEKAGYGNYNVILEVVDQPDYFKTGFEQTIDGGKTSWKH